MSEYYDNFDTFEEKKRPTVFTKLARVFLGVTVPLASIGLGAHLYFSRDRGEQDLVQPTPITTPHSSPEVAHPTPTEKSISPKIPEATQESAPTPTHIPPAETTLPTAPQVQETATVILPTSQEALQEQPEGYSVEYTKAQYGITVFYSKQTEIPIGYQVPGSPARMFTQEEIHQLEAKRAAAIASGEPEHLFSAAILSREKKLNPPSQENPYVTELPEDVLTPEELSARGIEIIQPPQTENSTQLFIRESAFEPGGIFEALRLLQQYTPSDQPSPSIEIVLVDGPRLLDTYAQDPRYDAVREQLFTVRKTLSDYRNARLAELQSSLASVQERRPPAESAESVVYFWERDILFFKQKIAYYQTASDAALLDEYQSRTAQSAGGMHLLDRTTGRSIVFVAVGNESPEKIGSEVVFSVLANGSIDVLASENHSGGSNLAPRIDQSYPQTADFNRNTQATEANNQYPFRAQSAGLALTHEVIHALLKYWLPELQRLGKLAEFSQLDQLKSLPDMPGFQHNMENGVSPLSNEFVTDTIAMWYLQQAYTKWETSGFIDDTGYPFVFFVPPSAAHPQPGYQITDSTLPTLRTTV